MSNAAANKKMVTEYMERVYHGKSTHGSTFSDVHDDYTRFHEGKAIHSGKDEAAKNMPLIAQRAPNLKYTIKNIVADDDSVWVWATFTGMPSPGPSSAESVEIHTIKDGKIFQTHDVQQALFA